MAYVTTKEMLQKAHREGYAVGAFNVENMTMVQAVVDAAAELDAPVIIQTTPGTLRVADVDMFVAMVKNEAAKVRVPIALHLDHGNSFELAARAMKAGYTSVMIDGSKLEFEENIAVSGKVAELAHALDIPVEAELGTVGGKEDGHHVKDMEQAFTDPEKAEEFVKRTEVDFLALGIGNAHGFYKGVPKLRFDILLETKRRIDIPLVLHGASGIPDEDVRKATGMGIAKVNFATELRAAYSDGVKSCLEREPDCIDPKKYSESGKACVRELVKHKITVCGSAGRA